MELSDPLRASAVRGLYTELRCKTLSLGDRVKRGPDWSYGEQDSRLDGTVIGQSEIRKIFKILTQLSFFKVLKYPQCKKNNYLILCVVHW